MTYELVLTNRFKKSLKLARKRGLDISKLEIDINNYISKKILECKNRLKFNCAIIGIIDYLLFGILEAKFVCK